MSFTWWKYPTRRFRVGGKAIAVSSCASTDGLHSQLTVDGIVVARDVTPMLGPESVRNHRLDAALEDGRTLEVELGYMGLWTTGIVAWVGEELVYESHKGRVPAYPEKYRDAATQHASISDAYREGQARHGVTNGGVFAKHNRIPFAVDIATGLLFYAIAKLTDLQTAAMVGVVVGFGLIAFQKVTKIDVTGGLALFGIVMLCISAGLAWWLADEEWIKLRGTITGLIAASFFLFDGVRGGPYIGKGLARYMPYSDIDPGRFAIGMGCVGLFMAALNYVAAKLLSTDAWLFYTTFIDIFIVGTLAFAAIRYARSGQPRTDAGSAT
jgi:intracellular septation protein A